MRKCFIRFGRGDKPFPYGERSQNSMDGSFEDGVSVYEAIEEDGVYQILLPKIDPQSIATIGMCFNVAQGLWGQANYPLFEVDGDIVGTGSDGEPLLKNCRLVKKLFQVA